MACSKTQPESASAFTQEFAAALKSADPTLQVEISEDLKLEVHTSQNPVQTAFLNNAFTEYHNFPTQKAEIFQRHIKSIKETIAFSAHPAPLDKNNIVPIIKDREWLTDNIALLAQKGQKTPAFVSDDLNADLVILYAFDAANTIKYVNPSDLEQLHLQHSELRSLACKNLDHLLPSVQIKGSEGIYMLIAGGTYESSLLLADDVWKSPVIQVKGEIVIAVPARDTVFITGSENPSGLSQIQNAAQEIVSKQAYRLTPKLFVYRNGTFVPFNKGQ